MFQANHKHADNNGERAGRPANQKAQYDADHRLQNVHLGARQFGAASRISFGRLQLDLTAAILVVT